MMAYGVREREFSWFPGADPSVTRSKLGLTGPDPRPHLVDVTMLYAPRSGGVKRYLNAKRAWLAAHRPALRHSLVVPGAKTGSDGAGLVTLHAPPLPFGDGYRWPSNVRKWTTALEVLEPTVIEAGDPYAPGQAALEAGQACGVPVVGFCHSDPAALAALHLGEWAKRPVEKRWARLFSQFDRVVAPSRYIAGRLADAGVERVTCRPLGVDVHTFMPGRRDPAGLRRRLGLPGSARLLVFAGRPAKEKNIEVLIEAVQRLGPPYVLLLVGAGSGLPNEEGVICLPYERDPRGLARLLSSCDAFVHANDHEPFGLIVLEAMACGLPVAGVASGGVAETVDPQVGVLASSADPADFAEAVEALFQRDLEAMGRAARARAVERFAWERVFEDLGELYAQLSGEPAFTTSREPLATH